MQSSILIRHLLRMASQIPPSTTRGRIANQGHISAHHLADHNESAKRKNAPWFRVNFASCKISTRGGASSFSE